MSNSNRIQLKVKKINEKYDSYMEKIKSIRKRKTEIVQDLYSKNDAKKISKVKQLIDEI